MSDATREESFEPSAFNLPSGNVSESLSYPSRPLHIVLATTGSVASVKAPLIVKELLQYANVEVQVVATESSLAFYDAQSVVDSASTLGRNVKVWRDADEWSNWKRVGDPILHIELRRWVDLVLIAPCSANTLAKLANGICDNLLTSMMRALDNKRTIVFVFPAMNTHMYDHPLTAPQLETLNKVLDYQVFGPIGKLLACGDMGLGAMTEWKDIVALVAEQCVLERRSPEELAQGDAPPS